MSVSITTVFSVIKRVDFFTGPDDALEAALKKKVSLSLTHTQAHNEAASELKAGSSPAFLAATKCGIH